MHYINFIYCKLYASLQCTQMHVYIDDIIYNQALLLYTYIYIYNNRIRRCMKFIPYEACMTYTYISFLTCSLGSTATTEQVATDYNSDGIIDDGLTDVPTDVPVTDTIMDLETNVLESGQLGSLMAEDIRRILS